jgi:hypothetical protein
VDQVQHTLAVEVELTEAMLVELEQVALAAEAQEVQVLQVELMLVFMAQEAAVAVVHHYMSVAMAIEE